MSNAVIGALRVNLGIDTAEFQNGARKAQGILGGLSGSIKAFAAGAVGALSLGGLAAVLKSTFNHMDNLNKAAQRFGLPVEELSRLEYAGRLADVSLETLGTSVQRLSKSLAEIQGGRENDAGKALAALGISATTATGQLRPTSDIMSDVAEKFSVMQDGAAKTATAMALFGRAGAAMIPLLNGGRDAIKGAGDEAQRFGLVISEQTAVAAEQFNDNLTRLKAVGEGLSTQVAAELAPAMAHLSEELVNVAGSGDLAKGVGDALNFVIQESARFVVDSAAAWAELAQRVSAVQRIFEAVKNLEFTRIAQIMKESGEEVAKIWEDAAARVSESMATISGAGKGSLPSAKRTQAAPIINFGPTGESAKKAANDIDTLKTKLVEVADVSADFSQEISGTFQSAFSGWIDSAIDGTFRLQDALSDLLRSLSDLFLNQAFKQLFGAGGGLFGGFSGLYASGGHISSGRWGIVGEAGPEIVHGPANVTPMGGGSTVVNIINQSSGAQIEQRQTTGPDGSKIIEAIVRDKIAAGGFDGAFGARFGIGPKGTRR